MLVRFLYKLIFVCYCISAYAGDDIPAGAEKLMQVYPEKILGYVENQIIYSDDSKQIYDDHKHRTFIQLLEDPDIKDQFFYEYPKVWMTEPPTAYKDPGRIANESFLKKMYGYTEEEVRKNLVTIVWCPKLDGRKILFTKINGAAEQLKKVIAELDEIPDFKEYVSNIGGSFKWRYISGTTRLSRHSFGIAIDINVSKSNYWQWDCKCKDESQILEYQNRIPKGIVEIFEKYGFIWGGKWYHYDTMHFEYRPELL